MSISILIILSLIVTFVLVFLLINDELNCSGQLHLGTFIGIMTVSLIPFLNLGILIWFLVDTYGTDPVIYRRNK